MFFDNSKYFNFVSLCRSIGIEITIIPSIKLITLKSQINTIPDHFKINIPKDLVKEIQSAQTKKIVREIGIEWAKSQ